MRAVQIGFRIDDREADLLHMLRLLGAWRPEESVELDLRSCSYLGPLAATTLAALEAMASASGGRLAVRLPESPPELRAYCEYSGLAALFAGARAPNVHHPDNETVPLQRVRSASFNDSLPVQDLVRRHLGDRVEEEWVEELQTCINEITQNVSDHANSEFGCFLSARFFRGHGTCRVAIADGGIGIGPRVRLTYPEFRSDDQALARVVEGSFTTRSRRNNAGQGIRLLRDIVTRRGGELTILSQSAVCVCRGSAEPRSWSQAVRFPGTALCFHLPLDPP